MLRRTLFAVTVTFSFAILAISCSHKGAKRDLRNPASADADHVVHSAEFTLYNDAEMPKSLSVFGGASDLDVTVETSKKDGVDCSVEMEGETFCKYTGAKAEETVTVTYTVPKSNASWSDIKADQPRLEQIQENLKKGEYDPEMVAYLDSLNLVTTTTYAVPAKKGYFEFSDPKSSTPDVVAGNYIEFFGATGAIGTGKTSLRKRPVTPEGATKKQYKRMGSKKLRFPNEKAYSLVCSLVGAKGSNPETLFRGVDRMGYATKTGKVYCGINVVSKKGLVGAYQFSVRTVNRDVTIARINDLIAKNAQAKAEYDRNADNEHFEKLKAVVTPLVDANDRLKEKYAILANARAVTAEQVAREKARLEAETEKEKARLAEESAKERARQAEDAEKERARLAAEAEQLKAKLASESAKAAADEKARLAEETAREKARLAEEADKRAKEAEAAAAQKVAEANLEAQKANQERAKAEKEKADSDTRLNDETNKYFDPTFTEVFQRHYYTFAIEPTKVTMDSRETGTAEWADYKLVAGAMIYYSRDGRSFTKADETIFPDGFSLPSKEKWAKRVERQTLYVCAGNVAAFVKTINEIKDPQDADKKSWPFDNKWIFGKLALHTTADPGSCSPSGKSMSVVMERQSFSFCYAPGSREERDGRENKFFLVYKPERIEASYHSDLLPELTVKTDITSKVKDAIKAKHPFFDKVTSTDLVFNKTMVEKCCVDSPTVIPVYDARNRIPGFDCPKKAK